MWKDPMARDRPARKGHFLLKLLNMLFQISGAEKMDLKDYRIPHFIEKNCDLGD